MAKKNKSKFNIKLPPFAFLVCLLIAALSWVIVNFSKEYTVTMNYRVVCEDIPANKQFVAQSDSIVNLTFKATGFNYLNPRFSERNRVVYLSVTRLTQNSSKRNVYSFNRKVISDYIRNQGILDQTFVEMETPESLTIYLK